jgi:membrane dipeptidase
MKRREFVRLASVGVIAPEMLRAVEEGRPSGERARLAWPGYEQAFVVDALAGPMQFNIPQGALPLGDEALDHISSSGITAVNLTVNARAGVDGSAFDNTRARIATWARELVANPATLVGVRSVADLRDAKASQKLGLILGFQDAVPIEDDLGRIEEFYELGVRIVQLTYNVVNKIGSGCLAADDGGLSELGVEVVDCLDERRVLIDLSHCGPRTTLDGIRASRRPVSLTHSGCRAVFDHPRSKDDATLRLLAENGGVVGIYLMPFLNPSGPPSAAHVLAHIEHALDVCGEDHVGIGSDQGIVPLDVGGDFTARFEEVSRQRTAAGIAAPREDTIPYVPDLNHPRRLETIADHMSARGHPSRVIEKVLGANFMRLFEEVWG